MTTNQKPETPRSITHEYKQRDKYGRSVTHFEKAVMGDPHRHHVVVVTMPKAYRERFPEQAYLVNDWDVPGEAGVAYFAKRSQAIAHARALVEKEN